MSSKEKDYSFSVIFETEEECKTKPFVFSRTPRQDLKPDSDSFPQMRKEGWLMKRKGHCQVTV